METMGPDELFSVLMGRLGRGITSAQKKKIQYAYQFASRAHAGQTRESGEPYITHPVSVALILADMGMDAQSIIAALLHDVIEDTPIDNQTVIREFGQEVFELVDGVTKLGKIPYSTREEQQAENIRKMLIAMARDIRVIVIKLADRLHNMRTIEGKRDEKKRRETAHETMDVYAPIAHRLGMRMIKEELEDRCLRQLDPIAYKEIEDNLATRHDEREAFLNSIKEKLAVRLRELHMKAHIEGRVKSIYGIYRKMYMQGKEFDEIYDIYAVRIIVDTVTECYNVLGVIHDVMHPIPGRFKDYISTPKPNLYQSLHTTVIGREGIPFEVQIRTWDMHYTAEYGIAAHWKYKAGIKGKDSLEERLAWIRQLLDIQRDADDAEDFVKSIKTDLSLDEVFVFTPKGDVINLPSNSTVIDFAYAIHSAVGNRMVGAKVNGKIVSLDYKLNNGEIVEIITTSAEGHGPNRAWLKLCRTSEARSKIRQWFKREQRDENIKTGKEEIEREFKRNGINLTGDALQEFLLEVAKRQHYQDVDDFYAAIGYGGISLSKIIPRLREEYRKLVTTQEEPVVDTLPRAGKSSGGVRIEGIDGCLVKFSQCCNPLPGDDIIGFITRGSGVSIHKIDCPNVVSAMAAPDNDPARWVKAEWDTAELKSFKASLRILAVDRFGMLADIASVLAGLHVMITSINARSVKDGNSLIELTIVVDSLNHLQSVVGKMQKVDGVLEIKRAVN